MSMEEQLSLFDLVDKKLTPGEWVEEHGDRLTFDEITRMVGEMIIIDKSTSSHEWFKAVTVERIAENNNGRILVYYDGHPQRGLIAEHWFSEEWNGAQAYRVRQKLEKPKSDFPCDDCVFDKNGVCTHIEGPDFFCENGSFQIKHQQAICSRCGKKYEIRQDDIGPDFGVCRKCGMHCIFNNQGNRPSAMELWKRGELVGI